MLLVNVVARFQVQISVTMKSNSSLASVCLEEGVVGLQNSAGLTWQCLDFIGSLSLETKKGMLGFLFRIFIMSELTCVFVLFCLVRLCFRNGVNQEEEMVNMRHLFKNTLGDSNMSEVLTRIL